MFSKDLTGAGIIRALSERPELAKSRRTPEAVEGALGLDAASPAVCVALALTEGQRTQHGPHVAVAAARLPDTHMQRTTPAESHFVRLLDADERSAERVGLGLAAILSQESISYDVASLLDLVLVAERRSDPSDDVRDAALSARRDAMTAHLEELGRLGRTWQLGRT